MTIVAPAWAWMVPVWITLIVCATLLAREWLRRGEPRWKCGEPRGKCGMRYHHEDCDCDGIMGGR